MSRHPDPQPRPLDHLCEAGGDTAPALVLKERVLTYADLRREVAALAGWLAERTSPGERVASWAAKGWLTCLLPLAAARAGVVHVPINPLLKRDQAGHILRDSGARLLLGSGSRLASLGIVLDTGLDTGGLPNDCIATDEQEVEAEAQRTIFFLFRFDLFRKVVLFWRTF